MNLKIAKVIGLNTDQKAAQVIFAQREASDSFLAVLDLECDDAFTKGRQVLSELEDFYFDSENSSAEKLKDTFKEAEKKFEGDYKYDLCLGAISGKALFLIGKGEIEGYLKRSDKLLSLLSVGGSSQLISGFTSGGDKLLFTTKNLRAFLGDGLEETLNLPTEVIEEEVGAKLAAADLDEHGLAALVLQIENEEGEDAEIAKSGEEFLSQDTSPGNKIIPFFSSARLLLGKVKKGKEVFNLLKQYFPKSGRGKLMLAVVLLAVISVGVGYKFVSTKNKEKQAIFLQALKESREAFDGAKQIATLNPSEAKVKLEFAKEKVNKALSLKPNDKDAQSFKAQMELEIPTILQESSVSDFPLFLDLELIKKGFKASSMSLSGNRLLVLDASTKTLAVIDLNKKSNQILGGSENLGEASFASVNGELAFIYSRDKGILRSDTTNSKITSVAKRDEEWGKISDIYGFGGNVYLLDTGKKETAQSGQIWKYLPSSEGYSDKREYLSKDTKPDFGNAIKLQIESSVYVLKSGGEVLRFTRGVKDNFSFAGLDKGVKDPKSFFVSSDTDNLYMLDSGNSRLLILTKTGEYKGQILGDKFTAFSDLVVDEKGKKVYLLEGSKLFQVDLK